MRHRGDTYYGIVLLIILVFVSALSALGLEAVTGVGGFRFYLPALDRQMPAMGLCIPDTTPRQRARTVAVIDGDTIDVTIGGQRYRVRYIGVDTPERGEPFYREATGYNRSLVEGRTLTLIRDVSETDRYGRLLRYVVLDEGFVNYALVREGYAMAATFPPDVACASTFARAQEDARREGRGIWAPTPTLTPSFSGGQLRIAELQYRGRDEYIAIHNQGSSGQDLSGWTLVSVVGNQVFTFPSGYVLTAGMTVRVHSGPDAYSQPPLDLFWTRAYIWNNSGDKAELRSPEGRVVDTYCYAAGCP